MRNNEQTLRNLRHLMATFLSDFEGMPTPVIQIEDGDFFDEIDTIACWQGWHKGIVVRDDQTEVPPFNELADTVKHELVHAWVDWQKLDHSQFRGHGEAFIKKAIDVKVNLDDVFYRYPETRQIYARLTGDASVHSPTSTTGTSSYTLPNDVNRMRSHYWAHPLAEKIEAIWKAETDITGEYFPKELPDNAEAMAQQIADDLLVLFDHMPRVKIRYMGFWEAAKEYHGVNIGNWGAGFTLPERNEIVLHIQGFKSAFKLTRLIKHEMIHVWFHWLGCEHISYSPDKNLSVGRRHLEWFCVKAAALGSDFIDEDHRAKDEVDDTYRARYAFWKILSPDYLHHWASAERLRSGNFELPEPPEDFKRGFVETYNEGRDAFTQRWLSAYRDENDMDAFPYRYFKKTGKQQAQKERAKRIADTRGEVSGFLLVLTFFWLVICVELGLETFVIGLVVTWGGALLIHQVLVMNGYFDYFPDYDNQRLITRREIKADYKLRKWLEE